jgi:serine/threonine protein kinase
VKTNLSVRNSILFQGNFGGENVLIKEVNSQEYIELEKLSEFKREILLLENLDDNFIQPILGYIIDNQTSKISIVNVHKKSLKDVINNLSFNDILNYSKSISLGIKYLHDHTPVITHNEISLNHIFVNGNGVIIGGLGKNALNYVSEVLVFKNTNFATANDIYQLGIVLLQMISPDVNLKDIQLVIRNLGIIVQKSNRIKNHLKFVDVISRCLENTTNRCNIDTVIRLLNEI